MREEQATMQHLGQKGLAERWLISPRTLSNGGGKGVGPDI